MIESIENMKKALKEAKEQFSGIVMDEVGGFEAEIIDFNTSQLFAGIYADGTPIEPGYRPFTIQIKRITNQPTDRVTLKDEGDFYDGFFVQFGSDFLVIGSRDEKAIKIERKYGREIYGLTDENLQELRDLIEDGIAQRLRKLILI